MRKCPVCRNRRKVYLFDKSTSRTLSEEQKVNPDNVIEENCPICEDFFPKVRDKEELSIPNNNPKKQEEEIMNTNKDNQSYVQTKGHQPKGELFNFNESTLEKIMIDFVRERTGVSLNLQLGCLDNDSDVYVRWDTDDYEDVDEAFTEEQWSAINEIGLHQEEDFLNRDALLQLLFGPELTYATYLPEHKEYEIFVPSSSNKEPSFVKQKGYTPIGVLYVLEQDVIEQLINEHVTEKVGQKLELHISCLDEDYDVYVRWNTDKYDDIEESFTEEQWKVIHDIGLDPEEDLVNRDILLTRLFGNELTRATYIAHSNSYEIFVPYPIEMQL